MRHNINNPLEKRILKAEKKIDWFGRFVQFILGSVVGAVIAIFYVKYNNINDYMINISIRAVAVGLLVAIYDNKFWKSFKRPWWWGGRL